MRDKQEVQIQLSKFEDLELQYAVHPEHGFLMSAKTVAKAYGSSQQSIDFHKSYNKEEIIEGVHFIKCNNPNLQDNLQEILRGLKLPSNAILWTRQGVVRLGFFIKSERAKKFRDWAEGVLMGAIGAQEASAQVSNLPATTDIREGLFELLHLVAVGTPHKVLANKIAALYKGVEKGSLA